MDFFRHFVVESGSIRRIPIIANGIAVLFVSSRDVLLHLWHGAAHLPSLGSSRRAWGRRYRRCCFGHGIGMGLTRFGLILISVEARASVQAGNMRFLLNPGGKVLEGWHMGVVGG